MLVVLETGTRPSVRHTQAPAPLGALGAGDTIDVVFGGVAGVPADAGAVFATVTGTQTAGPGFTSPPNSNGLREWCASGPMVITRTRSQQS